jgi:hypothetical protein
LKQIPDYQHVCACLDDFSCLLRWCGIAFGPGGRRPPSGRQSSYYIVFIIPGSFSFLPLLEAFLPAFAFFFFASAAHLPLAL